MHKGRNPLNEGILACSTKPREPLKEGREEKIIDAFPPLPLAAMSVAIVVAMLLSSNMGDLALKLSRP
jgi:hypothetical protein